MKKETSPFQSLEDSFLKNFDKRITLHVRLNLFFWSLLGIEFLLLLFFSPFLIQSAIFSFGLAAFVLTFFGYFLLNQYFNSQKWIYFEEEVKNLILHAKNSLDYSAEKMEDGVEISKLCCRLAEKLYAKEYRYYPIPKSLSFLKNGNENISAWLHWKDVHLMREKLLEQAVQEHLLFVRLEPTNPDAHALLANAYVMLSGIYLDPRKFDAENEHWFPKEKYNQEAENKFKEYAKKAIEEFKILKEYSPNDPWVYNQLAYSYRDLQMPLEEQAAYEAILTLRPNDSETLFKLGHLYFKQGENARGLKIYQELKKSHFSKADELLTIYGRN